MSEKKRILIIEDEEDLTEMIRIRLENEGYLVDLAYDGEEGLDKAKSLNPDLITLDIMMPKLNGYEVCKRLKTDEKYKHIPILVITVRAQESDRDLCMAAGADDHLSKPYDRNDLISKVKQLLKEG